MDPDRSFNSIQSGRGSATDFDSARLTALLTGSAIALFGLTQKSATRVALVGTGATIASFGIRENASGSSATSYAESSIIVNISPAEAYSFWRDFENFPRFMNHLKSVIVTDASHSRWVAYGPLNKEVEWDAEITAERENQFIAWRAIEGSDLDVSGSVMFSEAIGDRGTLIKVKVQYGAGPLGRAAAKIFGKDPSFLMRQDMRRFKALVETGELPTTEGQSHGPRSALNKVFQAIDPDEPVRKRAGSEVGAKRRVS